MIREGGASMLRADNNFTHIIKNIKYRVGKVIPFGATVMPGGVNFSIYSKDATYCELVLFKREELEPYVIIPFPDEFQIGDVYSMFILDLDFEDIEYGYRMDGPFDPAEGHRFDKSKYLLDPYAKSVGGRDVWGVEPNWDNKFQHRGRIVYDNFNWEGDKQLELPMEDLIIYEAHLRGFTKHESSDVDEAGTFAGLVKKIPYLKELGINAIELLPVFEFDEFDFSRIHDGKRLYNYWGYSSVSFFAPKSGYASGGQYNMEINELKFLIKELHKNGIEVILDVVFNHTAEGNEKGPYISYRGIDNKVYYLLTPDGHYYNYSGCGNTINCNHAIVRNSILDCLRYWVYEYHIDGFRFDLASILTRNLDGSPMAYPPLLEELSQDGVLSECKLIAEAWDAGGLYQVGHFPSWQRWAEWNGKYRDSSRKFLRGEGSVAPEIRLRMEGSKDMYQHRTANASINFITCHDGFTLHDLVSYNDKHNAGNGEGNRDGGNDNHSWNCGVEGETNDETINKLRFRQMQNAMTILLCSRGIPMLLAGDEFANTQFGNNNGYCQDNEISWLDWSRLDTYNDLFKYVKGLISFRQEHPVFRNIYFDAHHNNSGYPEVSWHGIKAWNLNSGDDTLTMGFMLVETKDKYEVEKNSFIYIGMNMHWDKHEFELPLIPEEMKWYEVLDTGRNISYTGQKEIMISDQRKIELEARSIVIVIGY